MPQTSVPEVRKPQGLSCDIMCAHLPHCCRSYRGFCLTLYILQQAPPKAVSSRATMRVHHLRFFNGGQYSHTLTTSELIGMANLLSLYQGSLLGNITELYFKLLLVRSVISCKTQLDLLTVILTTFLPTRAKNIGPTVQKSLPDSICHL